MSKQNKISKDEMIKQILQRPSNSKNTLKITNLKKMKVAEIQALYSGQSIQSVQQEEKKVKERPARIVRNFEDISDSEDDSEEVNVPINIVQQVTQQVLKEPNNNIQQVVQQPIQVIQEQQQVVNQPNVEQPVKQSKIKKNTELKLDHVKEPEKQLTVQGIRKEVRNRFALYNKDLKLLSKDFKHSLISKDELIAEFSQIRDQFCDELEDFLDTQKKLSDVQYDYINKFLEKSVSIIEDSLSNINYEEDY